MKIKLEKSKIKAGKSYYGCISRHFVGGSNLKVYVELDDEPDVEYVKVIPIEKNTNSRFARFAREMGILDKNGDVETKWLDGLAVKAVLKQGKDGNLYVNTIRIDYDYYKESEGDEKDENE